MTIDNMFLDNNDNEYGNREANILFVKKNTIRIEILKVLLLRICVFI